MLNSNFAKTQLKIHVGVDGLYYFSDNFHVLWSCFLYYAKITTGKEVGKQTQIFFLCWLCAVTEEIILKR